MRKSCPLLLSMVIFLSVAGCGAPTVESPRPGETEAAQTRAAFKPIDETAAVFWDRQTTESAELLRELADEFNAGRTGLKLKVEHMGGYSDIFRKVSVSIGARTLPAMAVAYESMTAEYTQAGAVAALDPFINDPEIGLDAADLEDFFPAVLETNRFDQFGGNMYSFPFCKSVLMLYFNKKVMAEAGLTQPPQTWDEFLAHCRQIKAKTGKHACSITVDCSTVDGMIFSMGGEVYREGKTLFDSPEALRVFELLGTLMRDELAFQVTPGTYEDKAALSQDRIAYYIGTSSGKANMETLMEGDYDRWGLTRIPQADPANPRTVLYGPNICIFNTTPEQQRTAWEFTKFFTSPEITARWSLGTGYLPIRKSAAQHPLTLAYWAKWEYNRAAFDCLAFAKPEPNVANWQEVRSLVEKAETEALTGVKAPAQAAADLKQAADAVLARG